MVGRLLRLTLLTGCVAAVFALIPLQAAVAESFYMCVDSDGVSGFSNYKIPGQKCKVYMDPDEQPKKPAGAKCHPQKYRETVFYKCVKNGIWYVFSQTDSQAGTSGGSGAGGGSSTAKGGADVARVVSSDEIAVEPRPKGSGKVEGLDRIVEGAATEFGIPVALLYAVIEVESGFNPNVVSPVGAQGLMQLMPVTADYLNLENPFDPEQNVRAGAKLLRILSDRFEGNLELVMAAYYAGASTVKKAGNVVPTACEGYVARVMDRYRKHAGK